MHKTLGRSHLSYEAFESAIMDVERNLNNRPLTYVETEGGEEEVLTPNVVLWGRDAYPVEDIENSEAEKLTKMSRRLEDAKAHVWKRWKREYVNSLMESHRLNKETGTTPKVGEIVLIVRDEKNRGEWKKGKVVRLVQGKEGVVRGVTLFHKVHTIERPLQLVEERLKITNNSNLYNLLVTNTYYLNLDGSDTHSSLTFKFVVYKRYSCYVTRL